MVFSSGTERATLKVPPHATDCHHHIHDHRFPWAPEATLKAGNATVAGYEKLQQRLGTTRNVIIQPSGYGVDNRLLIESIAKFNGQARGIAVVKTNVTQHELDELDRGGVRGVRFNLAQGGHHDGRNDQAARRTRRADGLAMCRSTRRPT